MSTPASDSTPVYLQVQLIRSFQQVLKTEKACELHVQALNLAIKYGKQKGIDCTVLREQRQMIFLLQVIYHNINKTLMPHNFSV